MDQIRFYNHMPAIKIHQSVLNNFDHSYKFAFERHPVDKCLSHFAMLLNSPFHCKAENPITWEKYLEDGKFPIDTSLYTDGEGRLMVDKLYRYEEIAKALGEIAVKTGLENRPLAIREKSGFRYRMPTFSDIMTRSNDCGVIWRAFKYYVAFFGLLLKRELMVDNRSLSPRHAFLLNVVCLAIRYLRSGNFPASLRTWPS